MKLKKEYIIAIPILLIVINIILVATSKILVIDNWVYSLISHNTILTNILLFITNFGSVKYIVAICLLLLIFYKHKKELMNLYGVVIISTVINNIIKIIIDTNKGICFLSIFLKFNIVIKIDITKYVPQII